MSRALLIVPLLAIGLSSTAFAGSFGAPRADVAAPRADSFVHLAQSRDAEVYYDGNGNRVLVDPDTGEVIAVQPRRYNGLREQRQELRRERRERRDQDRYYLDDPEDMARLRRERQRGIEQAPDDGFVQPDDDYTYADPGSPADDGYGQPGYDPNEFPAAPRDRYVEREAPPVRERRQTIERAPLDEQVTAIQPEERQTEPETTGTISRDPEPSSIDPAQPPAFTNTAREDVAAIQVLMDRAGASPGVIDGKFGSNVDKALAAYRTLTGRSLKSTDTAGIKEALAATGGDPFVAYTISPADAAGPFVASVPADYSEKAKLDHMSYMSVTEMLGERFHMDEGYLKALNPEANFSRPGTVVRVANIGSPVSAKVARITADKKMKQVLAYDAYDKLVAAYPATIGSADTPSPTGTHIVSRIALDPNYTYNPKLNFKQGENDKVLTIPPGPNGPVGSVWIALDKPTYGVHGTPDPSKIGKTESHGCVRLTNWDAQELAKLVSSGTVVEFLE